VSNLEGTLIFTDLDGTLLDHEDYSFDAALPVLKKLAHYGVPVIPVTSKTRAELHPLRDALGLDTPFVVENGAAIYLPKTYFSYNDDTLVYDDGLWCKAFAPSRLTWQKVINDLPTELRERMTTFSELGDEQIAELTGLSLSSAKLANERGFSEPIHWSGSEEQLVLLENHIEDLGYTLLRGGRFLHLTSGYDKGRALVWLKQQFLRENPRSQLRAIALGDSGNDRDMLEAADQAIVIRNPHSKRLSLCPSISEIRSSEIGPAGWAETLNSYLNLGLKL